MFHYFIFFFFNDTATTEIYTLSLHDALPICRRVLHHDGNGDGIGHGLEEALDLGLAEAEGGAVVGRHDRSEEHTSELQSRLHLVCRLLLEKKKHCRCSGTSAGLARRTEV